MPSAPGPSWNLKRMGVRSYEFWSGEEEENRVLAEALAGAADSAG